MNNEYVYNRFHKKHESPIATSSADFAARVSCRRNTDSNLGHAQGRNTVLFNKINWVNGHTIDKCGGYYSDIFQCSGIPTTGLPIDSCVSTGSVHCRSCKERYPTAQQFYVQIAKNSGHLFYKDVWYHDGNNWRKMPDGNNGGTSTC